MIVMMSVVFNKLTIFSLTVEILTMMYMIKVVGFHKYFNIVKENFVVYKLHC